MAQITYSDSLRQRKRVHYTGSDTLYEGEPLCYSFKTTRNWYGYSDSSSAIGDTTAEGSHNEGKYIYVESPMRISLSSDTPADGSKTITGTTTDFDALQVGMFVSLSGTDVTNGNYEITAISRSTESGVTNSTITLDMTAATGTTADVATAIDNISSFAGVVAAGSWVGQAGPCELDIYIPNGAVVPVRNDQNCVLGRTILAVNSNEQHLTAPLGSYARPVAIAWETVDTATTTGLVLAKLDPNVFIYQRGDNAALLADDEDTGDMIVNRINLTTAKTAGRFTALEVNAEITSTASSQSGGCGYGLSLYSETNISGILSGSQNAGVSFWTNLNSGADLTSQYFGLEVGLYESGADLSSCGILVPLCLRMEIDGTDGPTASRQFMMYLRSDGTGDQPDGLFAFYDAESVKLAAQSSASVSHTIPIYQEIGDTTYYIMVSDTA